MEFVFLGLALLLCLCIFLLIYLRMYKKQVRRLCNQMDFLNENYSELRVASDIHAPELIDLTDKINRMVQKERDTETDVLKRNDILRETIANLSHDIRTPLTSLDGYFQLMTAPELPNDKMLYYRDIVKSRITYIREMLEELFLYAKLQDVGYGVEMTEVDAVAVAEEILMSFYEDIAAAGKEPVVVLPEEPAVIMGNREALSRVLQNLIKNVMVHGKNMEFLMHKRDNSLYIEINDEPYGDIQKINTDQVFERFYKADPSRTKEGSGLGMAIAKEFVLRMNGIISAQCNGGKFRVIAKLPLSDENNRQDEERKRQI